MGGVLSGNLHTLKLEVGGCDNDITVMTFTNNLKDHDQVNSLYMNSLTDFDVIVDKVKTCILATKDVLSSEDEEPL